MITGTFTISLDGQFLPMQLIYAEKTDRSIPKSLMKRMFTEWFVTQISKALKSGKAPEAIDITLNLLRKKSIKNP